VQDGEAASTAPVGGQCLGDQLWGEAFVDEHCFGVGQQIHGRRRDAPLLRYPPGGPHGQGGLEPGGLHRVGAAMGPPDQPVLLQYPQVPSYRLGRYGQVGGELADVDGAVAARQRQDPMLSFLCPHTAPPSG
jgi:hypothetical protein